MTSSPITFTAPCFRFVQPTIECERACEDLMSFGQMVRWLVRHEVVWVVALAVVLWLVWRWVRRRFRDFRA